MFVAALFERRGSAAVTDSRYRTAQLTFLFSPCGFGAAVAAGKFLDAPSRIHELLFPGEKGMASGANTDLNIAARGAGVIHCTAGAHNIGFVILWMNTGLHLWKGARNLLVQQAPRKR
jgi:hypothetical protein